jgi:hypothetical protein
MRSIIISAVTFGAALLLGTAAGADESIQVGGKVTCKTPEQPSIPVEGDPGHVLFKSRPASAVPPANLRGSTVRSKNGSNWMIWSKALE